MAPRENEPVTTWVDDKGDAWTLVPSSLGVCWLNLHTMHTQWQPPWERESWRCLRFSSSSVGAPVLGHGYWWARGFGRPRRLWKHSTYFLREAGFGQFFNEPLVSGSPQLHLVDFTHFLLHSVNIWTSFPRVPRSRQVVLFLRNAWLDSGYHLCKNNYRFDVVQIYCFRINIKL